VKARVVKTEMPFRRLVALIELKGSWYLMRVYDVSKGPVPTTLKVRGNTYTLDMSAAYKLKGWSPLHGPTWWWGTYYDVFDPYIYRPGFLVFREPTTLSATPIAPLDRQAAMTAYETLTPWSNHAYTESKLKAKYDASTKYGGAVDARMLIIILAALFGVFAMLVVGGFISVG